MKAEGKILKRNWQGVHSKDNFQDLLVRSRRCGSSFWASVVVGYLGQKARKRLNIKTLARENVKNIVKL